MYFVINKLLNNKYLLVFHTESLDNAINYFNRNTGMPSKVIRKHFDYYNDHLSTGQLYLIKDKIKTSLFSPDVQTLNDINIFIEKSIRDIKIKNILY